MELSGVCRGCLAGDRRLEPPGRYSAVLDLLAPNALELVPLEARVCWECRSQLRRLQQFSDRVQSSSLLLHDYWRQTQAGEAQLSLDALTKQCQSSLVHTTIRVFTSDTVDLDTKPDSIHEQDPVKSEFLEVSEETKSIKISIKPELHFDLDDDEPLINHKSEDKNQRRQRKSNKKARKTKQKSSKRKDLQAEEFKVEEVSFPFLSDGQNEEGGMGDGIFDEIADAVQDETSDSEMRPVKRRAVTKKTKTATSEKVKGKQIQKKIPVESVPASQRHRAVVVPEEELAAWRAADAALERYTTMRLPHKCATCLLPFRWREQLAQHDLKRHHPSIGDFACDVCEVRFATESEMSSHRQLHLTRYECLHCEYVTRDKKDIDKHYELQHCEAKYKCTVCGEAFKTFFQQRYHREAAHRPLWQCQHCDKSFRLRGGLYSHMRIHQELPKAECPVCSKVYKNKYALMYHLRVHEVSSSAFYCQGCDVHFKSKNQLRLHMTTSMKHVTPDKLKYACETCGRRFITDKRREHHHDSVHLNKTEFACTECSKAYANKQSLRSHVLRKHKQTTLPRDKICDICGKGFHNNVLLRNHMRTHTGERPFHCKLCPSTFSYSAALYTHNRLVHLKMKREKVCKRKPAAPVYSDKGQWEGDAYSY